MTDSVAPTLSTPGRAAEATPKYSEASFLARFGTLIMYVLAALVTLIGWRASDAEHITPESGAGYLFGIIGGSMMLLMLLYSARKRFKFMRNWLRVAIWFRLHMVFGIVGPIFILYHANFRLGATNSNIAVITMLIVSGSGLAGRYIYRRIHYGLYGRLATLKELQADLKESKEALGTEHAAFPELRAQLEALDALALPLPASVLRSAWLLVSLQVQRWRYGRALRKTIRATYQREAETRGWNARVRAQRQRAAEQAVVKHMRMTQTVATFNFYDRLFALWHVLHLPLFFFLFLAAIAHIIAVHLY